MVIMMNLGPDEADRLLESGFTEELTGPTGLQRDLPDTADSDGVRGTSGRGRTPQAAADLPVLGHHDLRPQVHTAERRRNPGRAAESRTGGGRRGIGTAFLL